MKKEICNLVNKMTLGKVCLGWCEEKQPLDFNQMLDLCWKTALGITREAKLYQASSPKGLGFIHCVFRGDYSEFDTIIVNCTNDGEIKAYTLESPYLEDQVIHFPIKMTEKEAETCLYDAGYPKQWTTVVLRSPLYSVHYPPLYIFSVVKDGMVEYIAVDSTDGKNVFPMY